MKTRCILLPVLLFCVAVYGVDDKQMLEALEADAIPDEIIAKINALPNEPEQSSEMAAIWKALKETAHTPDYENYKPRFARDRVLRETRFFIGECYAVPSRPLHYESVTHAGDSSDDVTGFLISGPNEQDVKQVAKQLRGSAARYTEISKEQLGDVEVARQKIEHGCELLMARELRNRLLADVGPCTHEADACSAYHARVKAWLNNQEKAEGSKDLAVMLFACIRGPIITE